MGWKGTMRSMAAASRAAARDAERRRKAAQKQQSLDDAYDAVQNWEDYIAGLISVHVDLTDAIDWQSIASAPKPNEPKKRTANQNKAETKLRSFKPGFLTKLSGGSEKRIASLEADIQQAKSKDLKVFKKSEKEYKKLLSDWEEETQMARRLISGDVLAFKEVIGELESWVEEDRIGGQIRFQIMETMVHAIPTVHSDDIIPKTKQKLRASGSLSETKMPAGEFNELYQDYVASVALKIAGDIFHVLPIDTVLVTCLVSMLNSKTGHKEDTPILSVKIVRETFKTLNLERIDPSDSMENFVHSMNFKRTKGFLPTEPLEPIERELSED